MNGIIMIPRAAAAEEVTCVGAVVGGDAGVVVDPGEEVLVLPAGSSQESDAVRVKLLPTIATVAFSLAALILRTGNDSARKRVPSQKRQSTAVVQQQSVFLVVTYGWVLKCT
jgi:uncharacterized membrane protein YozB (DUF420 family)